MGRKAPKVLYGYRRLLLGTGASPFELMFGVIPRMDPLDPASLIQKLSEEHHRVEMLAILALRATKVDTQMQRLGRKVESVQIRDLNTVYWVSVAHRKALTSTSKWPAFKPHFLGSCFIWKAAHPGSG